VTANNDMSGDGQKGTFSRFHAEYAWVDGRVQRDVLIDVTGERFTAITPGGAGTSATRLPGLVLSGFANPHSHAFHRALRGRTHGARGDFWSWRDLMYSVAATLDPDGYFALARAVYGEMALAGITCVGEFHYLHHGPDGSAYADPNAMGHALLAAAAEAGIRITLLDTLYLSSSVDGSPLEGAQRRFGDGDFDGWAERVEKLEAGPHARIGAALHSIRAVPAKYLGALAGRSPLHLHLSEQRAENERCLAVHGCTPTDLLRRHNVLGPATTAVHATHLTDDDIRMLGETGTGVCFCPTTERDLADGIGPARALADAGAALSLGSDSHAVIDPFEEARGLEMHERLASNERGRFAPDDLLDVATARGYDCLGWSGGGRLEAGALADLVAVRLDTVGTAGSKPGQVLYSASRTDVDTVVVGGRPVVEGGHHRLGDVAGLLASSLSAVRDHR